MTHRPYLDYYSRINDIPVPKIRPTLLPTLDVERFYQVSTSEIGFSEPRILEIGPGTGDNATATLTFGPAEIRSVMETLIRSSPTLKD